MASMKDILTGPAISWGQEKRNTYFIFLFAALKHLTKEDLIKESKWIRQWTVKYIYFLLIKDYCLKCVYITELEPTNQYSINVPNVFRPIDVVLNFGYKCN